MLPIPNVLAPALAQVPAPLLLVSLLAVSLVMIFAGGTLAKVVAFLAVGLAGAALGGSLAAQYLSSSWAIIGLLLGFVVGGMLGVALLSLGVGIAVGYAGYLVALDLALGPTIAILVGVAFFVVGLLLSSKIISLATAVLGGLLLFGVLTHYGFGPTLATFVAGALTLVGLYVQLASRHASQPQAGMGGQNARR
jgi:hypothetical protein